MRLKVKAFVNTADSSLISASESQLDVKSFTTRALAILNDLAKNYSRFNFVQVVGEGPKAYDGYSDTLARVSTDLSTIWDAKPNDYMQDAIKAHDYVKKLIQAQLSDIEPYINLAVILQDNTASFSISLDKEPNLAWRNRGVQKVN
jgi:methyltransferase-like protein